MLDKLLAKFGYVKPSAKRATGFSSADYSRITASLQNESEHIMRILRYQGKALRARSRQLANNNCYATKFLTMAVSNVCGPSPFRLQAKIKSSRGRLDTFANSRIESEWSEWGRPGQCDVSGRWSWSDLQRLVVRSLVTDGEALVRVWEGSDFGAWGLQLQLMDTDRLDEDKNEELPGGNVIIAGVELNPFGRTVAYHFLKSPPKTWNHGILREHIRIPAEQIIHLYMPLYAEQVRGVPWMYSAIVKLHQLGAFEEAAIIAARVGASKMGFYQQRPNAAGDLVEGMSVDARGDTIQSAEPGEFGVVPDGYEVKEWSPNYPDTQVGPFMKSCLRGISSGFGVSYHSLGNDLEAVNFSSARAGLLEERDQWMLIQEWLIEHLHVPLYRRWLRMADLTKRLPIQGPVQKYFDVTWSPKRWQWVDPFKDVQANAMAIQWGLKSRTQVVAETGNDLEDIFGQLADENAMAEQFKLEVNPEDKKQEAPGTDFDGGEDGEEDND
jgi:lambda family phage portal protein